MPLVSDSLDYRYYMCSRGQVKTNKTTQDKDKTTQDKTRKDKERQGKTKTLTNQCNESTTFAHRQTFAPRHLHPPPLDICPPSIWHGTTFAWAAKITSYEKVLILNECIMIAYEKQFVVGFLVSF